MGIRSLLQTVKAISDPIHIQAYREQRVAVDSYAWLHVGAYQCAKELVLGEKTRGYIDFCLRRVDLLQHHGVIPVMVFDGANLPAKLHTEDGRRSDRDKHRRTGVILWNEGQKETAIKSFQKAVNITPEMANALIFELRARGVECITAPYEADAQLAYLALTGYVNAVITEDSDLLCFGCPRILYKMEESGRCQEVVLANLGSIPARNPAKDPTLPFANWSFAQFQWMCILSGCDYISNLGKMGPETARKEVNGTKHLPNLLRSLKSGKFEWRDGYELAVYRAWLTFNHQRVYCPTQKALVHLRTLPSESDPSYFALQLCKQKISSTLDFLGPHVDAKTAELVANGFAHPTTKKLFPVYEEQMEQKSSELSTRDTFNVKQCFPGHDKSDAFTFKDVSDDTDGYDRGSQVCAAFKMPFGKQKNNNDGVNSKNVTTTSLRTKPVNFSESRNASVFGVGPGLMGQFRGKSGARAERGLMKSLFDQEKQRVRSVTNSGNARNARNNETSFISRQYNQSAKPNSHMMESTHRPTSTTRGDSVANELLAVGAKQDTYRPQRLDEVSMYQARRGRVISKEDQAQQNACAAKWKARYSVLGQTQSPQQEQENSLKRPREPSPVPNSPKISKKRFQMDSPVQSTFRFY